MLKKLIALNLLLSISAAQAAEPLFSTFFESGQKQLKEGHYQQAEKQFELALANSEHLSNDSEARANLYKELGTVYCRLGKLQKAEDYLQQFLALRQKQKPHSKKADENKIYMYEPMLMLGTVYRNQDKFQESERLYKESLQAFSGNSPINLLCQSTVLFALGTLYLEMSKPQEAETVLKAALDTREKTNLKKYISLTGIYDSLGCAYKMQGRLEEAKATLTEALDYAVKEKNRSSEAFTKTNLALTLVAMGKYDEANNLLKESLSTLSADMGENSNNVASCYANLARVATEQDRYEEAETLLNKAIEIHSGLLGERHTNLGGDYTRMARLLQSQGKYEKAEEYSRKALSIFLEAMGENSIRTAQARKDLAALLIDENNGEKLKEAQTLLNQASSTFERESLAMEQSETRLLLAQLESARGEKKAAEQNFQLAITSMEAAKDKSKIALLNAYSAASDFYQEEKQYEKALDLARKALNIRRELATSKAQLLPALTKTRQLQEKLGQGDNTEASALRKEIDEILAASPQLQVVTQKPADITSKQPERAVKHKWALVIGISNFADADINLRYAAKDAIDFANYLVKDANFPTQNVKLLTDKDATRENIIRQLGEAWLGKRAGVDDLVVIYISSHGSTSLESADGVNFLVAHDTSPSALLSTGIPMQWLSQMIKEQVHAGRVVLVLDVCHSGAASRGAKGLKRENSFNINKLDAGSGQAIICSSAPEQVSWESKVYPNSVFTRRLIEALKQKQGRVDLATAYQTMREEVAREVLQDRNQTQTPLYFAGGWQGPAPVLAVSVSAAQTEAKAAPAVKSPPARKKSK